MPFSFIILSFLFLSSCTPTQTTMPASPQTLNEPVKSDNWQDQKTESDSVNTPNSPDAVTVSGKVSLHFEGGSASGIEGYSFTIEQGNNELFLRINGKAVHKTKGPYDSPLQYYNNVLNGKTILPDKNYALTGVIKNDDKYNPERLYLDILEIEELP